MTTTLKVLEQMTTREILIDAKNVTVIDDGQFRYPVRTEAMRAWAAKQGKITASNYDAFCSEVECLGEREVGTPGNKGMIDFCAALIDAGADLETLG